MQERPKGLVADLERPRLRSRPRCYLATLHPEQGLLRALREVLTLELADVEFVTVPSPGIESIWVCGFEPGNGALVRRMRRDHPAARIVVTRCGGPPDWEREVLEAGADRARAWPMPLMELSLELFPTRRHTA